MCPSLPIEMISHIGVGTASLTGNGNSVRRKHAQPNWATAPACIREQVFWKTKINPLTVLASIEFQASVCNPNLPILIKINAKNIA